MGNNKTGMRVIALGTAGGPIWHGYNDKEARAGIGTVVQVDGTNYLVDCGSGVGPRYVQAGLDFVDLGAIFITHMHSDHTIDLNSVMVVGGLGFRRKPDAVVPVFGPGARGCLPPISPFATEDLSVVFPDAPTPGTAEMVELLLRAHATDLNDRRRDSLGADTSKVFQGRDISLPSDTGYHPNDNNHPNMAPFEVFRDEKVRVAAILVQHEPVAPAFAFRFDSKFGSVVISGDTGASENLVKLSQGADLLLHEAIDLDSVAKEYTRAPESHRNASMDHHRRAHTTAAQAGELASRAGVRTLALHHLVPVTAPASAWQAAAETFSGELVVLNDLQVLDVGLSDTEGSHDEALSGASGK